MENEKNMSQKLITCVRRMETRLNLIEEKLILVTLKFNLTKRSQKFILQ